MDPRRTDRASRRIGASADRVWQAWFDPAQLVRWLPPAGMSAQLLAFDPSPGGAFRMRLTYLGPHETGGKTTPDSDEVAGRFVEITRPAGFTQDIDFVSQDPQFAGTMRMGWHFEPVPGGTLVSILCENVPPGISAADHAEGLAASLANLAAHVE